MINGYKSKYPVQTLEKALDILTYLKENPSADGHSLNTISEGVGMGKSTVHRFLDTLLEYDFVEKSEDGTAYKLGWGIFEMASNIPLCHGIDSEKVSVYLKNLSNHFGEIINLGIKNSNSMVIIKRFFPNPSAVTHRLITNVNIGEKEPLCCTGIGKLFLSEMDNEDILLIFRTEKDRPKTEYTITDESVLLNEIAGVRQKGFAVDNMEASTEVFCIAVPLWDYTGKIIAGISISVPAGRLKAEDIDNVAEKMKSASDKISRYLGYIK